jgi:hypothetical protein
LFFSTPGAIIFENGYFQVYVNNSQFEKDIALSDLKESPENLLNAGKLLILPTGSLFGNENDSTLKAVLQEYVYRGGVILVLAQQFGNHIDKIVPIPEGQSLHSYGFREDQSCSTNSTYAEGMHPVLASLNTNTVSAAIDGYFSVYPKSSTVLLRKKANQNPCLLYYPYGQGTVILTSLYTDWGAAHSQASAGELKLVRDLVTFAKNPSLPIPMHKLTQEETPQVSLTLNIKNDTESPAAKVKIKVLSPDRKKVLYESEQAVALAAGGSVSMPVSFSVAYSTAASYGIAHTDYELYDADGKLLQMASEADSGRFALYQSEIIYTPPVQKAMWLTVDTEYAVFGMPYTFTLHVRNLTDTDIQGNFGLCWDHDPIYSYISLLIPAGQTIEKKIEVSLNDPNLYGKFKVYGPDGLFAIKGIRFVRPQTESSISVAGSTALKVGAPFQYTVHSLNKFAQAMDVGLVLKLLKWTRGQVANNGYNEVATLMDTSSHMEKDGTYEYTGLYTPDQFIFSGYYVLKLEVTNPDRTREIYFSSHFSYIRSNVGLTLATIPEAYQIAGPNTGDRYGLIPGQTYSVNFK